VSRIREWGDDSASVLFSVIDVTNACHHWSTERCASALSANSDQLKAVARDVDAWLPKHPCPYRDVDTQLARLARSCDLLAAFLEVQEASRTIDWSTIDSELHGLHQLVARTFTMIYEQSLRQD
jgi:hypothetical protein